MINNRIEYIDMAKGIGIILVVFAHIIGEGGKSFLHSNILHKDIYSFHMALFFVISGILLGRSQLNSVVTKALFLKKIRSLIKKLLIPYYVWSILYFIVDNSSSGGYNNVYEWFLCIITFRGRAPVWFLGALFWAEISAILLIIATKAKVSLVLFITCILGILAIIVCGVYDPSNIQSLVIKYLLVSCLRGILCLFFVMIGYLSFLFGILEGTRQQDLLAMVVFCLIIVAVLTKCDIDANLHILSINNGLGFLVTGISGSILVVLLCKLLNTMVFSGVLASFGRESLGIMCIHYTHFPFMQYATELCNHYKLEGIVAFLVSFCFVFSFSYVATKVLKQVSIL